MSGRIVFTTRARMVRSSRRVVTVTQSPSFIPCCSARRGMNFSPRFRILVHQCADAAGLGSRQILANHPARSQKERIFVIHRIAAGTPFRDVEVSLAVVGVELFIHEKAWRSGVVE